MQQPRKKKLTVACFKCLRELVGGVLPCACNTSPYYNYATVFYEYGNLVGHFPLAKTSGGLNRFLPLLPNDSFAITLGEGNTPLLHFERFGARYGLRRLFVKNEAGNPTGCFKDRETVVGINVERERGTKKIEIVSSGNAAVSAAAYSKRADIECICHIPETTSEGKKRLLQILNVQFQTHKGDYEDIYREVIDSHSLQDETVNFTSGVNLYKEEGDKTIAYEIFEQLGDAPDTVVVPVGNGSLLYGVYKGFWELGKLGFTKRLPRMIGVQIEGFSPIAEAMRQGRDFVLLSEEPRSIAEGGIAARESYCAPKVIKAIADTGGTLIEVGDESLVEALKALITDESFLTELTSLAPFAALSRVGVKPHETVVCVATGSAYKNLEEIFQALKGSVA